MIFRGNSALLNLAAVSKSIEALGPYAFVVGMAVDGLKVANDPRGEVIAKAIVNTIVGGVSIAFPEVGLVYLVLDHYGVVDGVIDLVGGAINRPFYSPNYDKGICPQDKTKLKIQSYHY